LLKITNDVKEFQAENECVVYFTADWCNPCKQLKPHYGRVAVMDPETNYYLVDVDKIEPKVVQSYSIQSIPQVFVMQKGKIIETIMSRTTEDILEELGK
jgi:thioredoxin 1